MCLFFGDFAIWSFLVYILFKVSMSSHKWSRVCSSALTINWISLSLILFSVWSILILFLSCWLFFYSTASRILNPPMQNHLYTPSFLFAIFFFFFFPQWDRAGSVMCWISVQCTSGTLKHLTSPCVISRMYFLALSPEPQQEFGQIVPHFCSTV